MIKMDPEAHNKEEEGGRSAQARREQRESSRERLPDVGDKLRCMAYPNRLNAHLMVSTHYDS